MKARMQKQTEIIARIKDHHFHSWIDRAELDNQAYFYRCINIVVCNTKGELLLQQRSSQKKIQPQHWDISVAGHIPKEDYPNEDPNNFREACYNSAKRELFEELGITSDLHFYRDFVPADGYHREYISLFFCIYDGEFQLQESEVQQVDFVSLETINSKNPKTRQLQWMLDTNILQEIQSHVQRTLEILSQTKST